MSDIRIAKEECFQRSLPVRFTEDQVHQFSEDLAEKVSKLTQLEDEKKQVASDYKSRIEDVTAEVKKLARYVTQKQEFQMVECYAELDSPRHGVKTVVRTDTGEVVGEETMTPADRQMVMKFARETNPDNANPLAEPEATAEQTEAPTEESPNLDED